MSKQMTPDQEKLMDSAGPRFQMFCLDHDIEIDEEKMAIFCAGAAYGVEKCSEIRHEG